MKQFTRSRALEITHTEGALELGRPALLRVAIPPGWHAAPGPVGEALSSCYRMTSELELLAGGFEDATQPSVEVGTRVTDDPSAMAADYLRRRMPTGAPQPIRSTVQGRDALFMDWTDGVASIATWFVELSQAGRRTAVAIVQAVAPAFDADAVEPVLLGARLLRGDAPGWAGACDEELVYAMRDMEVEVALERLEHDLPDLPLIRRVLLLRRAYGLSLGEAVAIEKRCRSAQDRARS
jgi:hypothetical protein